MRGRDARTMSRLLRKEEEVWKSASCSPLASALGFSQQLALSLDPVLVRLGVDAMTMPVLRDEVSANGDVFPREGGDCTGRLRRGDFFRCGCFGGRGGSSHRRGFCDRAALW